MVDGIIDLKNNTFKVTLHGPQFLASVDTHTVFADVVDELATGTGYTNGGQILTNVTLSLDYATVTFDCDDPTWTATGGDLTAHYFVIRKDGTVSAVVNPLIGYGRLDTTPAGVTALAGHPLSILVNQKGLFTIAKQ